MFQDTIVALSTAPMGSAIGVIRISGKKTYEIVEKIFNKKINLAKTPKLTVGKIIEDGKIIDEVVLASYFSPRTFTGEDLVEIMCHGNIILINKIIGLIIKHGARMAERGEFTKKAFLNGKLDLIQAEAINDLINATTINSIDMALHGVIGNISAKITPFKEELLSLASHIEVNIDYPEYEDIEELTHQTILPKAEKLYQDIKIILKDAEVGAVIKEGVNVAIIGKPNVGKSSLLNAFLNEDKAIVSEYAGTTRDIVEGSVVIDGIRFNFFDTAGIHDTQDFIENIGIEKSKQYIKKSDLVLVVVDGTKKLTKQDKELLKLAQAKKHLVVINKKDLEVVINVEGIAVSSLNKEITKLKEKMVEIVGVKLDNYENLALINNARQIGLLKQTKQNLKNLISACKEQQPIDIMAIDLMEALNNIQDILGEVAKINLEEEIFNNFCLGK